jgi:hypothetical protein
MQRHPATAQARNSLLLISAFIFLVTGVSLYANLHKVDSQYTQLAAVVGRSFFQAIDATRDWNAENGGVYVPVGNGIRPNRLLRDRLREVTTRRGVLLTKINHAEMVRLISGLLREERGIRIHITSETPLQPANAPDPWEKDALASFDRGKKEAYGVMKVRSNSVFRFMSPLMVEKSCLACHSAPGDKVGRVRGGISVSFSWAPFQRLLDRNVRQIWTLHLVFLAGSFLLIFLLGRKLIVNIAALQESLLHIKRLEGLVPICANCKKVRMEGANPFDQASWTSIEQYFSERTDAEFTHGLCPECAKAFYPDVEHPPP